LPANAAQAILGKTATPAALKALSARLHLNQPVTSQYLHWLGGILHGNLGTSAATQEPVTHLLGNRLANSAFLVLVSAVIAGPALELPWTKLVEVPELTPTFVQKLAAQSDAQANGEPVGELERRRDDSLVAVLHALRAQGAGAGETLAAWERGLLRSAASRDRSGSANGQPPAPLALLSREIPAHWLDYNGHVTESRYLQIFGEATDALLRYIGVDAAYLDNGGSYYTVETHISHLGQLFAGDGVEAVTQILGWDDRRLHLFHTLIRAGQDEPVALAEHMLLHVDATAGRASPVRDGVRERVAALAEAHARLPRPARAGRRIAL
jgi:carnitine 3-dehydrogenase